MPYMRRTRPIAGSLIVLAACGEAAPPLPTETAHLAPSASALSGAPGDTSRIFSTDWSEYSSGSQPAGWSQWWDPTSHFRVVDDPAAQGGKVLEWSATGQSRDRWGLALDSLDVEDQEVYTEFRVRSLGGGTSVYYMGTAAVRVSGTASDEHGYALFMVDNSGTRSVALSTWTAGGYTQLGQASLSWEADTWYSIRLRAEGSAIRARVWPRGTAEPGSWLVEATDFRYARGRPGISHHDNGTVQWDRWSVTVPGPDTVPGPPPPPPPGQGYQATFAQGATGVQPAGWTETSAPANAAWSVEADAGAPDGRVLRNVTTATGRHILRLDTVPEQTTTQEVLVRMRLADDDGRGPGVALRHRMAGTKESAYVAYLRTGTDQLEIDAFVDGAWQFVGTTAFVSEPGRWYWLRFRAEGSALRARVWADGQAEPVAWSYSGSHTALASGGVGVYTYEPNTVDFDFFSAAADGGSAAVPVQGPPPGNPTLTRITLTPDAATVSPGASISFTAVGTMSDGSASYPPVDFTATGGSVTVQGLYTAGTAAGTYRVIATEPVTGRADTAVVTIAAAPPSGSSYAWTFSQGATGVQPAGWTETSAPANAAWSVEADAGAPDGRVLRNVTTATGRHILRLDTVPEQTTTQEVLVRMRLADDDGRGPGVALRHRMAGTKESAYVAYLRTGTDQLEIDAFVDGAWQFVGTTAFVSEPGRWYWLRFRAEGSALRARVWADGQAEPVAWSYSGSHAALASGGVGVYTYEPNTVDFDFFSAAADGGSAAVPVQGPRHEMTFAQGATGVQPAGWTETSAPANAAWSVEADAGAPDGRVLRNVTTATGRHILRLDTVPEQTTTQEVLVRMRLADDDGRGPGVALRHRMAGTKESAYVAYLRTGTDQLEIDAFVDGAWQFVGTTAFVSEPGRWYWLRFRAEGSALRARVWVDGQAEPVVWSYSGSHAALASGGVGVYTYEPNTVDFDFFSAAADGGSATVPNQ